MDMVKLVYAMKVVVRNQLEDKGMLCLNEGIVKDNLAC